MVRIAQVARAIRGAAVVEVSEAPTARAGRRTSAPAAIRGKSFRPSLLI
jgi:hypothetical protein